MKDVLQKLIRRPESSLEEEKRPAPFLIWILLAAIVFLVISSIGGGNASEEKEAESRAGEAMQTESPAEYAAWLELRLAETLRKISGAGEVSVFISMENGGERVLATDRSQKGDTESDAEGAERSQTEEEVKVVLREQSNNENPYVVEERLPRLAGVLVVAEGAGQETVRCEIYEAVRALFGLPAHRVKITH